MNGQPLWTEKEIDTLKRLYPLMDYAKIAKKLKRRSYWAVRHKAQQLGMTTKRHVWTAPEINRLRRVYHHGTVAEIRAAFPTFTLEHIGCIARHYGMRRPRQPFKATGIPALDQIRKRAFELGYTMGDVDELARSKGYFRNASWQAGHIHHRAIAKAITALDGNVSATWNGDDTESPLSRPLSA